MKEHNVHSYAENETFEEPIYTSKFLMTRDLFVDFHSVMFNRVKKIFILFFCIMVYLIVSNFLLGEFELIGASIFISFFMALIYFMVKKSTKIGYERMVITEGKEATVNYELFDDRIVSYNDGLQRTYHYHQITKLFETKYFLLLHLQHNIFVTIEKNHLNANVDDVKTFLINQCTLAKKKKFVCCANDKMWSLVFLCALVALSVAGLVLDLAVNIYSVCC